MHRIFISYSRRDSEIADRLYTDLRNAGHDVAIDKEEVKPGDDFIDWMNEKLERSSHILVLYSRSSADSPWQKAEINAAIHRQVQQSDLKVIAIQLDSSELPPLLRSGHALSLGSTEASYLGLLDEVGQLVIPKESPTDLVEKIFSPESNNPFWRLRAEYYEEMPDLLAKAFSKPDAEKWGSFRAMRPCIVEGSRGTGKTMLLMSLRARNLAKRENDPESSIRSIFGFYFKLWQGAFVNADMDSVAEIRAGVRGKKLRTQMVECFSQEFYLQLLENLIDEIEYCVENKIIAIDAAGGSMFSLKILRALGISIQRGANPSIADLRARLAEIHREMAAFIRRKFILEERVTRIPLATLDLRVFKELLAIVKEAFPALSKSQITVLLDEYENLLEEQKLVVNDLLKLGAPHCSVKVAKKVGTGESPGTATGQPLQEIHDYNRINLVYQLEDSDDRRRYFELLEQILSKALGQRSDATFSVRDLLPPFAASQVSNSDIVAAVSRIVGAEKWNLLDESQKREKITYYRTAATFRHLFGSGGGNRRVAYAGFETLGFLSSGVVRYFLEILGTAYYLQFESSDRSRELSLAISPDNQSRAVHYVSEHNLTSLSRNVVEYGEQLKYFLIDLGDILRSRLLSHNSEPEAGLIHIVDPENLQGDQLDLARSVITAGVQEGILQPKAGRSGMRTKHRGDPQHQEFSVCRIYAPVLQFSYRMRWRYGLRASDVQALLNPARRSDALRRLVKVSDLPQSHMSQVQIKFEGE